MGWPRKAIWLLREKVVQLLGAASRGTKCSSTESSSPTLTIALVSEVVSVQQLQRAGGKRGYSRILGWCGLRWDGG